MTSALFLSLALSVVSSDPIAPPPKVPIAFNRLYDYPELEQALRALVAGHPDVLSLSSLGKSVEGREIWCVTINNPKTGPDRSKPAMYVDGNVHGNEVQAAEACLYLIWYLAENRDRVDAIKTLLAEKSFYVVPTVNPDGRAWWFNGPNTTNSSRSGKSPRDDDRDGLFDEDGYDDLDGDGQILQMRRKDPNGRYKVSSEDSRLHVLVKPGEKGEYELLGMEGIDNDGDGQINEDAPGGYDMNRNYPADWQPNYLQGGAGDFPLSWPETRGVSAFIRDHPNIAGVQSFHNAGGMILRGPGASTREGQIEPRDEAISKAIGETGARMLPFYRNFVIYKDLYSVHGGFVNWTYEHMGIFSFTNELWNNDQLLTARPEPEDTSRPRSRSRGAGEDDELFANDRLLFNAFKPWKPFKHPFYGDIELGGSVKQSDRVPPSFMLEELCHRNAAFCIYHADQMPKVVFNEVKSEPLGNGLFAVTVTLKNLKSIPSIAGQAARRKIGMPDTLTITGDGLEVLAGGALVSRDTGEIRAVPRNPAALTLESGIGAEIVRYRWLVKGTGEAKVTYSSQKAGTKDATVFVK